MFLRNVRFIGLNGVITQEIELFNNVSLFLLLDFIYLRTSGRQTVLRLDLVFFTVVTMDSAVVWDVSAL
jgi:hypothetical protein